jgi:hypothetical protein
MAAIDRLLQRLGSSGDPGALVDEILESFNASQSPDIAATGVAGRLVASPDALQQLAQLLHQQQAGTVRLLALTLIRLKGGGTELHSRLAAAFVATPPHVVESLVDVLGSRTADTATKAYANMLLGELVHCSQSCARQAARAGVFAHLAALLRQRPAGHAEAAGLLVLVTLCKVLVDGSANRAQLAMQQGVLEALPALLGEGYPPGVQEEAAVVLSMLLRAAPRPAAQPPAGGAHHRRPGAAAGAWACQHRDR